MLNVDDFYKHFHADWMVGKRGDGLQLSGRFMIFADDVEVTIIVTENCMDHASWIKRADPMKGCSFLSKSGQLGMKLFYDKKTDQTEEAINDCKKMFIDV